GQAAYPPGLKPLIAAAKDKDPRVRLAVAAGLTNFTEKKAIDTLKLLGTDRDPRIRREVDRFFKKRERLQRYRAFFKDSNRVVMKTSDKDPIWRADAAIALGIAGAESSVGSLIELLFQDKEEEVRLAAAWSLVLMASEQGEKSLKKAAAKDKSARVRLTARKYLVIDKVSPEDLVQQLRDSDPSVRRDAAEALSLQARSKVLNPLIQAAICDSSTEVRTAAMRGLARVGNPLARTAMKVALSRDPSSRARRVAYMMYLLAGGK
ncbi:MAG: HEAT repeat domain-containing protein, partial [Planctomycetota bacterium]